MVSHIEMITRYLIGVAHGETSQSVKVRLLFGTGVFLMALLITVNSQPGSFCRAIDSAPA